MPYYRRNLYVLSVTIFLAALSWNQIMPFLPLFMKQLGVRQDHLLQWVGIVFAAQSIASILAQPFWGKLGDAYGRKPMILRAGFCLAGVYFGMSVCNSPWQLAMLRFLNGALTGFIPGSFALIATNTPDELAPRSLATAQSAANVGLIAGPAIGGFLAQLVGYRGSMKIGSALVLISTLAAWLLVKEPNKSRQVEKTSLIHDFMTSIRSPVQVSILFVVAIAGIYGGAIGPYLTLHLGKLGGPAPDWLAGMVFSLPAAAFVIMARSWTRLGEKSGFDRTILIGLAGGAVGAFVLAFAGSVWIFAALYFAAGLLTSAISPSTAAVTCIRVDETFRGRAFGIQQAAGTFGILIAPLAAGWIGSAFGMRAIFVFVGFVFAVGALVFRWMARRWKTETEANAS